MKPSTSVRGATRREFVGGTLGATAVILATGCAPRATVAPARAVAEPGLPPDEALVLNRICFGPSPRDAARLKTIGLKPFIEEQLRLAASDDPEVERRFAGLETQETLHNEPDALSSEGVAQLLRETRQAALLRATYSRHQLREVLADFWTNHFNIYARKADGSVLIPVDTERALRPHLTGKFSDLLYASAHSPAMLAYLDSPLNRRGITNENYAREILELHTLGVNSGYTQRDIQETARCFSGWSVSTGWDAGKYRFNPDAHDNGTKRISFLNLTIPAGGGQQDGETVLASLARHPATARHLAGKLGRHFLGSAPSLETDAAAAAYLAADTDITAILRPILLNGLTQPAEVRPVLKRPIEVAVSAMRALGVETDGADGIQQHLEAMGQPLYEWPMPDGFPEKPSAWSSGLLPRWNFALALAGGTIPGTTVNLPHKPPNIDPIASALSIVRALFYRDDVPAKRLAEEIACSLNLAGHSATAPDTTAAILALAAASPLFQYR